MQTNRHYTLFRFLILGCLAMLAVWVVIAGQQPRDSNLNTVDVQSQDENSAMLPEPESTNEPTVIPSPTWIVIPTPSVKVWPSPLGTPQGRMISTMDQVQQIGMSEKQRVNRNEAVSQVIWAPTGDKWLYLTTSGDLYWSNIGGNNATFLHKYKEAYNQLEEQRPLGNTLLVRHLGDLKDDGREATHMDVINFNVGMPPTIIEGPDLEHPPHHLHWWSADRASGIAHTSYDGGDLLVTLKANGNLVEEINVPYMLSGAVRPGGRWLAYATSEQVTNPLDGSSPQTVYLLDLVTGERKQATDFGSGYAVGNWSPDGNWFLMSSDLGVSIVSANLYEQVIIPEASVDAVWSPDSRYLAFTNVHGESSDGHTVTAWSGKVRIVNVPERKVIKDDSGPGGGKSQTDADIVWQPKWSPNSARLMFLSFNPDCPFQCSKLTPAILDMAVNR